MNLADLPREKLQEWIADALLMWERIGGLLPTEALEFWYSSVAPDYEADRAWGGLHELRKELLAVYEASTA